MRGPSFAPGEIQVIPCPTTGASSSSETPEVSYTVTVSMQPLRWRLDAEHMHPAEKERKPVAASLRSRVKFALDK